MFDYKGYKDSPGTDLAGRSFFSYNLLLHYSPVYSCPANLSRISKKNNRNQRTVFVSEADYRKLEKIHRASTSILKRLFRSDRPCLLRSLIMYRWCCRNSLQARVVIGVYKESGLLQSHAWLKVNEAPFNEDLDELRKYTSILEG